jgi:hypothetical protein
MLDRKQMVAEIADEVVSRLLTHLDAPAPAPGQRCARPVRARNELAGHGSSRPWTKRSRRGAGAGARAEMGPRSAAGDCRDPADLRRAGRRTRRWNSTRPASAAWNTKSGS